MKRIGNLYDHICSLENLELADKKARKGKLLQRGVIRHDQNRQYNILMLQHMLINKTFTTSKYNVFRIQDGDKEREIFSLPYWPDRICHHAINNVIEPIITSTFTADTYACVKGRGTLKASMMLRRALRQDPEGTKYALKIDIRKFYPSVNHTILKQLLRKKIKDKDLLWLLDDIIKSAPGLPIGNLISQGLANFYLTYFDHWLKGGGVANYFRYCDDCIILAATKEELWTWLEKIRTYLEVNLKLTLKSNWQIFPVAARGIDFVGYVHFHSHTRLRKGIKKRFAKMLFKNRNDNSVAAYLGWLRHSDCRNLEKKLLG